MDVLVIGAGIFGTSIACELSEAGHSVTLVEKDEKIMQRASRVNHNRVHFGYHYPRSRETARQCLDSIPSFYTNYSDAIVSDFPNYYTIASEGSFITPDQFIDFCKDVKIDFKEEYPDEKLLRKDKLAASFRVREPVFSTSILSRLVADRIDKAGVQVMTSSEVESARRNPSGGYSVMINGRRRTYHKVVNATYSGLNEVNKKFKVRPRELRFERTVVPIFEFRHPKVGLTVMDGPFCTVMPHGKNHNHFLLWHVDGCVLSNATDVNNLPEITSSDEEIAENIFSMSHDFMPFMKEARFVSLLKTTKTVYENKYDARVSEVHTYKKSPDFISVLSGKIMCAPQISYHVRELIAGNKDFRGILV